jgi:pyruvate-ferredoxin/flavodoxin oxidoreductase
LILLKNAVKKTYGTKGDKVVQMNYAAIDKTVEHLFEIPVPAKLQAIIHFLLLYQIKHLIYSEVTAPIIAGKGDDLPVSKMPIDGTLSFRFCKMGKEKYCS